MREQERARKALKYQIDELLENKKRRDADRNSEIAALEQRLEELKEESQESIDAGKEKDLDRILDLGRLPKRSVDRPKINSVYDWGKYEDQAKKRKRFLRQNKRY